ncbi:MAG TPA: hypothetical protein VHP37_26290, partial [Burkholderiales bacterium]|nr:hypothetical protein [Burkholderiales bacterium]
MWTEDRNGNRVTLVRGGGFSDYISRIVGPTGRYINLSYDGRSRISQATDNTGRTVTYAYDTSDRLATITNADGKVRTYVWDTTNNRVSSIKDERNNTILTNQFDTDGRVWKQTLADASTFTFVYTTVNGVVTKTELTDRRGSKRIAEFDANGRVVKDTFAATTAVEQVTTIARDPTTGRVTSVTDPLLRQTDISYDSLGNVTQVKRLANTATPVIASATYDPVFSNPLTNTDPNGNVTNYTYDVRGNLTEVRDALDHTTTLTYDTAGRLSTVKNALNVTVATIGYTGTDLTSFTDALSRTTTLNYDSRGRLTGIRDPMGRVTTATYDVLDRLSTVTDALGGAIGWSYDASGNVRGFYDRKSQVTSYVPDGVNNRPGTRSNPLGKTEFLYYEPGGKISRHRERKGQVNGANYDALGRIALRGFGALPAAPNAFTSTIAYTWDKGDRLRQIVDSVNGTITRDYDDLDRLTQETTAQGVVTYTYDAGGRRKTMQVSGQPLITYSWDAADQLKLIEQAAGPSNNNVVQRVWFTYNAAGRRVRTMYANASGAGVTIDYGYDDAGQVTSVYYKKTDGTLLGTLFYTYDAAGRRLTPGGTFAQVRLPANDATATYNANNQLASWNGVALTDDNGNLASEGGRTYVWNARNQLVGLSGGVNASFAYDGLGRRTGKTVGGATTQYVYDGLNIVQEKDGAGTPM